MIQIKEIIGLPSLKYHIDNGLTLSENVYRYSSDEFINLFKEARAAHSDGKIQPLGVNQDLSSSLVCCPKFSIMITKRNNTIIAPAQTIASSIAAKGAPRTQKITATDSKETTIYRSACTIFVCKITARVEITAITPAM